MFSKEHGLEPQANLYDGIDINIDMGGICAHATSKSSKSIELISRSMPCIDFVPGPASAPKALNISQRLLFASIRFSFFLLSGISFSRVTWRRSCRMHIQCVATGSRMACECANIAQR